MNNLTSFTAYFNSMKQTLQSHSMNYIELTNKIKELEGSFKAATPDFSNISSAYFVFHTFELCHSAAQSLIDNCINVPFSLWPF